MSVEALSYGARRDLRRVLDGCSDDEVAAVRDAVVSGRMDDSYGAWDPTLPCCVVGVIARERGIRDVLPFAERLCAVDLEDWVTAIRPGDVPDHTDDVDSGPFRSAMLVAWIDEWKAGRA